MRESTISKHTSWGPRSPFANAVGQTLRMERRRLRLSQRDLAGGFSASFVSRVELGDAVPSLPALAYLTDRIGLSLADFFERVADRLD